MNYRQALNQQTQIIQQKFEDQCIVAHSGGLFKITPEFLASLKNIKELNQWVLDMNNNPIMIQGIAHFHEEAYNVYYTALTIFGQEFKKLKTQRSSDSILDL